MLDYAPPDGPIRPGDVQSFNLTGRCASDRPLEADDPDPLGFGRIAGTISLFLRHKKTEPPLTFAITGEWGSGKSSLMNLLRTDLVGHGWRPVWFNAWHYQKEEHLLASLLDVIRRRAMLRWWQLSGLWVRAKFVFVRLWCKRTLIIPLAVLFASVALFNAVYPNIAQHRTITYVKGVPGNIEPAIAAALPETTTFFTMLLRARISSSFPRSSISCPQFLRWHFSGGWRAIA